MPQFPGASREPNCVGVSGNPSDRNSNIFLRFFKAKGVKRGKEKIDRKRMVTVPYLCRISHQPEKGSRKVWGTNGVLGTSKIEPSVF